jgi:hypothetical protein
MLDERNGLPLRPLGNESINKTLRTLGAVLDEAVDARLDCSQRRPRPAHARAGPATEG